MSVRTAMAAALLASIAVACAAPPPTPSPSVESAPAPTPTASPEAMVPISVRFKGRVNCNLGLSFACAPHLSVLEGGAQVPESWRPADTDPWWDPKGGGWQDVKASKWVLVQGTPATSPGRRLLVISLTGSSDMVSYNPDGSVASELLGRCTADVDVAPDDTDVGILVSFDSDPATTVATCTIEVAED